MEPGMRKKRQSRWMRRTVGGYPAGPRSADEIGPPPPAFYKPFWPPPKVEDDAKQTTESRSKKS